MGKLNTVDIYVARLMMVAFFLPQRLQPMALAVSCVYFVVRSVTSKEIIAGKDVIAAFLLAGVYFLYLAAIPMTQPELRHIVQFLCELKVSLLIVPVSIALTGAKYKKIILNELPYFAYGCLVTCLVGNAAFLYLHFAQGLPLGHVAYRLTFEDYTQLHPTYMGMYLGFALCILLQMKGAEAGGKRAIKYLLFYLLLLFMLALLAKSAIIAVGIIFMHFAYKRRKQLFQYKYQLAMLAVVMAAGVYFIPFIGQRTKEVASYLGYGKPGTTADNSIYTRKLVLDSDLGLLKGNWVAGVGPAKVLPMLQERYGMYDIIHNNYTGYFDPHSEYFNEWIGFGIVGIAVLLLVLILHLVRAARSANVLYAYCLIILCINFITETVLSRQAGVLFYAVFTSLFYFTIRENSKTTGQETIASGL